MQEIGRKIRLLRQKRNLALKELATKTNLTSSFLSQLENGITSPSVESLNRIAEALDTTVGYFFKKDETRELVFIRRQNKLAPADPVPNYEMLASGILDIRMVPLMLKLKPGETIGPELCPQGEEMLGVPVSGVIEIGVNAKSHTLEQGDSIYLVRPSFTFLKNPGSEPVLFLWTVLRIRD